MPTIKLNGGSLRLGDKRYTPDSEPFEVSAKLARILNCSVVPMPEPQPEGYSLDELRELAAGMGIEVKKQWSAAKLTQEISAHGSTDSE